mmetsp:Transcript_44058/g.79204  ORF Transcript_44058/g.79204 Transcript_44058/m.79204 type:complete len:369 (+) Transcript_44058:75-1181(+)
MMYLSREEREERAQRQRQEQSFRNSQMRNLPQKPRKPAVQNNPVAVFLNNAGLGRYSEALISSGFDDMDTLLDIEDEHMRQLGMPPGHIVKLKKRLREMREAPTVDDTTHHHIARVGRTPASIRQPDCTANQMTTVQISWVHVQNMGTDKVGEIFYKKFFKLRPDSKLLFPIGVRARYRDWTSGVDEDDDLDNSPALRKLFAKVIDAVGSAVAGLHDVGKLVPMLEKLGMRHLGYGMKDEYFQDAATVLIEVLKEGLGDMFTSDIEHAWVMVYSFMTATMVAGLRSAVAEVNAIQSSVGSNSSRPPSECASEDTASTEASKNLPAPPAEIPTKWRIEDLDESDYDSSHHISLDTLQALLKNRTTHGGA